MKADPEPEEDNTEARDNAHKCLLGLKKAKTLDDLKAVAKNNGIVCPPPFLKDIKKLREYVTTKLTAIADGTAPAKKKAGEKKESSKKIKLAYTRSHALIDSLQKGAATREEMVKLADVLFVENGGKTNENVSNYMFGYVVPSLLILGLVVKTGNTFSWKK